MRSGFRVMNSRLCHFTVELAYCSSAFQTGWIAKLIKATGATAVLSMVPSALDMPCKCSVTELHTQPQPLGQRSKVSHKNSAGPASVCS